jgi:eukaryotic-like serine/threonine-protein kinase
VRHSKVIVTTYGMSDPEAKPLLFLETGRGTTADEAFLLLCEASPGGRRVFGEAVGQYRRGERIRTPQQHVELVNEISSSCSELLNGASVSFASVFIRGKEFWWGAGGAFSLSCISPDGKVNHLEGQWGTGYLEPGDKVIAAERETLCRLDKGLEAFTRSAEEGDKTRPAVVLESERVPVLEKGALGEKRPLTRTASPHTKDGENSSVGASGSRKRPWRQLRVTRPGLALLSLRSRKLTWPRVAALPKLSPFGWISLVGAVAVIVVLLITAWPSPKKANSPPREKTPLSREALQRESPTLQQAGTAGDIPKSPGEFTLSLKWKKRFQGAITSSPVLYEGRVYFGCRDGGLYCLDAGTGEQVWKFAAGAGIGASPAVSDGRVFIGGYNGSFWCIDASSGQKVWEFKVGAKLVSSASVASGNVLFGSYDRNLYCVSAKDGKRRWTYEAAGVVWSSPSVEKGRVFFGSVDGTFYCLSLDSGKLLWKYIAAGGIYSSPAISEGVVCFGSNGRAFHFLDSSTGKELFRIEAARDVRASPLIVGATVYGASDDGVVRCIDVKRRTVNWTFKVQRAVRSMPFLSDGMLYVTSYDGRLHALEASSGKDVASFDTGAEIYSSPTVSGGMVYFGANNGNFYCLQVGSR